MCALPDAVFDCEYNNFESLYEMENENEILESRAIYYNQYNECCKKHGIFDKHYNIYF